MNGNMRIRVVLVEPLYEINIGYVARAMKNFALNELYLVRPRTALGITALKFASHAADVLKKAVIVESFEESIKDVDYVIGTTGKPGKEYNVRRSSITPQQLCGVMKRFKGYVALVFGREDIGLTNEELEMCDVVVTIPANPEYPILNLSHAAVIIFYELYKSLHEVKQILPEASRVEKERLIRYFDDLVDSIGLPEHRRKTAKLAFKRIIGRAFATSREVYALYGVFRKAVSLIKGSETIESKVGDTNASQTC